jgi:hypothetical protein
MGPESSNHDPAAVIGQAMQRPGQLVKGERRKNQPRPPPGLLVGNRLQEIEPDNVALSGQ